MDATVAAVEKIINYRFRNKSLLEEALTHPSHPNSPPNYQRLEFLGDAALGLVVTRYVFITYPDLDPGQLSLLRDANICKEKLARVAVKHDLYKYLRCRARALDFQVKRFAEAVEEEGDEIPFASRAVKAPKVLSDIVESIAGAVCVDCKFNLNLLWKTFNPLLEPIVTNKNLEEHPMSVLNQLCQKQRKEFEMNYKIEGSKIIATVYVDGKLMSSNCSEQKEIARNNAAKEAVRNLRNSTVEIDASPEETETEIYNRAKRKLNGHNKIVKESKKNYNVDFDGKMLGSSSSEQKEIGKNTEKEAHLPIKTQEKAQTLPPKRSLCMKIFWVTLYACLLSFILRF